jgi:hypothetical protein
MVWEVIIAKEKYIFHSLVTKSRTNRTVHSFPLILVGFPSKQARYSDDSQWQTMTLFKDSVRHFFQVRRACRGISKNPLEK